MESGTGTRGTRLGLIGLALVIFVATGFPPPLRAGPVGLDEAHLAVWRIHNYKPITDRKHKKLTTGTAFAPSPTHFVTNAHNLRDLVVVAGVPIPGLVVSQGRGATGVIRRIDRVLRLSEIHDLALFTIKREVGHWLRVAPDSNDLAQLTAIGYPGGHHRKRMRQVGRTSKDSFGWEFELPVDVDDLGAASGSPVLDVHGRAVVGVFFQADSNMATALSVEHLRAFGWQREGTDWVSCGRLSFRRCHEAAVENVRERARQKDPVAQGRQWHLYKDGVIDGNLAVLDSLTEAAEQGLRSAQRLLAFAYHDGDFVPPNRPMRDLWFRWAAEQDDSTAQYNLAATIRRSDPDRARALLEALAERGFVPAKKPRQKSQ